VPNTFTKIASVTAAGGSSTISFTSIPSTYTDLVIKVSARATYAANFQDINIRFNGSATGYSSRLLQGDGSAAASYNNSSSALVWGANSVSANATGNTFSNGEVYIPNYTSALNKSLSTDAVTENNATAAYIQLAAGLWSNTAAITSIEMYLGAGNYVQYSTFTLYGISKS
jgi:hypothetical protein